MKARYINWIQRGNSRQDTETRGEQRTTVMRFNRIPKVHRPMTPILETREDTSPAPNTGQECTFGLTCRPYIPEPKPLEEIVTSLTGVGCRSNTPSTPALSDVSEELLELRESSEHSPALCALKRVSSLNTKIRESIDQLEMETDVVKRNIEKASQEYSAKHKLVTSAAGKIRVCQGLRERADDHVTLWRENCRSLELSYLQERPELEEMKNLLDILKASIMNIEDHNEYLLSFVNIVHKKRSKPTGISKYLLDVVPSPAAFQEHDRRVEYDKAMPDQTKDLERSCARKRSGYNCLLKKLDRVLPRPPFFAPMNLTKLRTLERYLGKPNLRYGHGRVCTLKFDVVNYEKKTHGQEDRELKENWILAGKNCLLEKDISLKTSIGFKKLPKIGSTFKRRETHPVWAPNESYDTSAIFRKPRRAKSRKIPFSGTEINVTPRKHSKGKKSRKSTSRTFCEGSRNLGSVGSLTKTDFCGYPGTESTGTQDDIA